MPVSKIPFGILDARYVNVSGDTITGSLSVNTFLTPYAQVKTVAKSGGDYTTIQAAINAIIDATTTKRYCVKVEPGVYTENVVMKDYVDILGSGRTNTIIYGTSGTILTFPATKGTAMDIGITAEYGTLGANSSAVVSGCADAELLRSNVIVSKTGGVFIMNAIKITSGSFKNTDYDINYTITGAAAAALEQSAICQTGAATIVYIDGGLVTMTGNDVGSDLVLFETLAGSAGSFIVQGTTFTATNTGTGSFACGLYLHGTATGATIGRCRITLTAPANTWGYCIISNAGGASVNSRHNEIICSGAGTNYSYYVDSGDTLYSDFDKITAADGRDTTGTGTVNIASSLSTGLIISGNTGIGTVSPASALQVATTLTTSPRGIISSQHSTTADGARLHLRKSRGTNATPTIVVTGDMIGRVVGSGYDGSNYLEMGGIDITSEGTIAVTRIPTRLTFWTATDAAPSILTERMRIDSAGNVSIGGAVAGTSLLEIISSTASPIFTITNKSDTNTYDPQINFRTGATPAVRWVIGVDDSSSDELVFAPTMATTYPPLKLGTTGKSSINILDNDTEALLIKEATTAYLTFVTTNSGEKITIGKDLETGPINVDANSGAVNFINMDITGTDAAGTVQSLSATLDGTVVFTVYGEADGAGGLQNPRVGVNTSTPATSFQAIGNARIGDAATNYMAVATDGEVTLVGTARVNKIINLGIDGLGQGSTAPSVVKLGNWYGYGFGIGDDGYVRSFEMPYDWDSSVDPILKIHWYINEAYGLQSAEVRWQVNYSPTAETGEAVDGATIPLDTGDINIPATAKYLIESSITLTGIAVEDVIGMNVTRIALVGGTPPTAEPVIVSLELEYRSNKLGEAT